jgi:hypothetical protein
LPSAVLYQRADPLERRGTLRGEVWSAGLVLEIGDQLFQLGGGVLGAATLLLAQSRILLLELLGALEQVGRRILLFGIARAPRRAAGTAGRRVRGHVPGSGGERPNALPVVPQTGYDLLPSRPHLKQYDSAVEQRPQR